MAYCVLFLQVSKAEEFSSSAYNSGKRIRRRDMLSTWRRDVWSRQVHVATGSLILERKQ